MEQALETGTPTSPAETPVKTKSEEQIALEAKLAELEKTNMELQAQKEHWRGKYERDITSIIQTPEPSVEQEVFSDEGKQLRNDISKVNQELKDLKRREERKDVEAEFPVLKDKREEFDEFLEDEENKRISIKKAAKLFLAEKGLLATDPPERLGLEKPTAGGQTPPVPGLTDEQLEHIRKTDYRQYEKLIKSGQVK